MGYYNNIKTQYGSEAVKCLTAIKIARQKWNKSINHRIFLLRCRKHKVFPRHITQNLRCVYPLIPKTNMWKHHRHIETTINNFKRNILNVEISIAIENVKKSRSAYFDTVNDAKNKVPFDIVAEFIAFNGQSFHNHFIQVKNKQINKFNNLLDDRKNNNMVGSLSTIKNLTNKVIPEPVERLLSVGNKFAVQPKNNEVLVSSILADIEFGLKHSNLTEDDKDIKRGQIVNVLTNFKSNNKIDKMNNVDIQNQFNQTRGFLKENSDLIVLNSDKGNITCVMDKTLYKTKMDSLVKDENTYQKLEKDPTDRILVLKNDLVKSLYVNNFIEEKTKKELVTYTANPPRIYGNPKIHKVGEPLRPIVSCINGPTTGLSKFVTNILNNVSYLGIYNVKNSYELVESLKHVHIPDDYCLLSLDVTSLFTNVTVDHVTKVVEKYWHDISEFTNIPLNYFQSIIRFIFNNSYFLYDKNYYKQISGSAMGSPSSPIFANLVLTDIFKTFMGQLDFQVRILKLFVDDSLLCIPKNKIQTVIDLINGLDSNIKFTYEVEVDNKLPFLDLLLIRKDNKIMFDFYQKPFSHNRLLNYESHHPLNQKISIIKMLKHKIETLYSEEFRDKNVKFFKEILIKNNYPLQLINRFLYNNPPDDHRINDNKDTIMNVKYFRIPYHSQLARPIKHILENEQTKVAFYNTQTTNMFYGNVKDSIPKEKRFNVVYRLECECDKKYYGQTSQFLFKRIQQHKNDTKKQLTNTGLSKHVSETGHAIKWDNVEIVHYENNLEKRCFLEMSNIVRDKNNLNIQSDCNDCNALYKNILSKFK